MAAAPVRNDIAGTLGRMQPRCQRYRGGSPAQCEYAVAPFPRTRLSAIVRDQAAPGERVALALAVSEMQNVPPLGLEQPAVSFHKRSELRVLPSNGHRENCGGGDGGGWWLVVVAG